MPECSSPGKWVYIFSLTDRLNLNSSVWLYMQNANIYIYIYIYIYFLIADLDKTQNCASAAFPLLTKLSFCDIFLFFKLKSQHKRKIWCHGVHENKCNVAVSFHIKKEITEVFQPIGNLLEYVCWMPRGLFLI